jgi:type IV secretory pathway TraG/TraD family ATPase VirD4
LVTVVFFPGSWGHPVFGKFVKAAIGAHTAYTFYKRHQLQKQNAARFMDSKEEKALFAGRHRGLLLDGQARRLSHEESFRNLAVIATTGAGKTSSFILPNLLTIDDASIVVTDPSGALYAKTAHDLYRRGYEVLKLDPLDLGGSLRYNPLERARTFPEMNEIAHVLVQTANDAATGLDPFWTTGAQDILSILIKCLKNHPEARRYANLPNLQYLLLGFGDGSSLIPFVTDHAPDRATFQAFRGFLSQADRTMQGMVSQAKTALSMWSDDQVAKLTATNSFRFEQLREKKTAVFLVFPQNRIGYYSLLMNLFYTQLFHFCLDDRAFTPRSLPVYFLLDEFGHLKIPGFSSIITTTRQRRISISIVLQSVSQLIERYGRAGAETIINGGMGSRLFLSVGNLDEAQQISGIVGDVYLNRVNRYGEVHTEREPMVTPAALVAMPPGQAMLLMQGARPLMMDMLPYYKRREFARRAEGRAFTGRREPVWEVEYLVV